VIWSIVRRGLASGATLQGSLPLGLATCRAVGLAKAEARQRSTLPPAKQTLCSLRSEQFRFEQRDTWKNLYRD
jgi:hypothetical protein